MADLLGTRAGQVQPTADYGYVNPESSQAQWMEFARRRDRIAEEERKRRDYDRASAMKGLNDLMSQEYTYRYKAELEKEQQALIGEAQEIMKSGTDPFTATDPRSQSFQKRLAQGLNMANYAKQLDAEFSKTATVYQQDPNKWTEESFRRFDELSKMPLSEAINAKVPTLERRAPMADLNESFTRDLAPVVKSIGGENLTDQDAARIAGTYMRNLGGDESGVLPSINKAIKEMPEQMRSDLQVRAIQSNMTPQERYVADYVNNMRTPFSVAKWNDKLMESWQGGLDTAGNETWSGTVGKEKALKSAINAQLQGDLRSVPYWKQTLGDPNMSDKELKSKLYDMYMKDFSGMLKTTSQSRPKSDSGTVSERNAQEFDQSLAMWVRDITSGNPAVVENALSYVKKNIGSEANPKTGAAQLGDLAALRPGEEVNDVYFKGGMIVANVTTETGSEEERAIRPERLASEFSKNVYAETFKKVGRHYGTNEAGAAPVPVKPKW